MARNNHYIGLDFGTSQFQYTPTSLVETIVHAHANPTQLWIPSGIRAVVKDYYPSTHELKPIYFIVTEQPPSVRTISVNGVRYSVSLPYLINLFTLKQGVDIRSVELNRIWAFSFYRKLPLKGWDDQLLLCNLPNVESKPWNENMKMATIGWTCFNNIPEELKYEAMLGDPDGRIEEDVNVAVNHAIRLVDYYLTSDFDLTSETSSSFHTTAEAIPEVSSFERWEEETVKNPQLAYELDWLEHPEDASLRDVMNSLREATHCVKPTAVWAGDGVSIITGTGKIAKRRLLAMLQGKTSGKWF